MKQRLIITCLLLGMLLIFTSFSHPIKLTTSLIEYHSEKKNIQIECRVFIDDFANTINRKDLNASNLSNEDIEEIEYYFDEFYSITINSTKVALNYKSSKAFLANNVLSLKFSVDNITIKEGDAMMLENKLFFEVFGPLQSNKMTIRIPPFIEEDYHETTFQKFTINYQF